MRRGWSDEALMLREGDVRQEEMKSTHNPTAHIHCATNCAKLIKSIRRGGLGTTIPHALDGLQTHR